MDKRDDPPAGGEPTDSLSRFFYRESIEKAVQTVKTEISRALRDKHSGYLLYWLCGSRCLGGMTFIRAYLRDTGSLLLMIKGKHKCKSEAITKAARGGG